MKHLKTLASSLAIVLVALMATDYVAMAATGKPVLLGKVNRAADTTTIKAKTGPALKLRTRSTQPPLKVTSTTRVANLNADQVDGKSASELGLRSFVYRKSIDTTGTGFTLSTSALPGANYVVNISGRLDLSNAGTSPYCSATGDILDEVVTTQWPSTTSPDGVTLNMVGDFTAAQGEKLVLQCIGLNTAGGTISSFPGQELKIILLAVDRSTQIHLP